MEADQPVTSTVLYAARPGLRIWKANMEGTVEATYIFKDLLNVKCPEIEVFKGTEVPNNQSVQIGDNFGSLIRAANNTILTWYGTSVYIINPTRGSFVGVQSSLGPIKDVAVCGNEAFILRGGSTRWLVRIATCPDPWTPKGNAKLLIASLLLSHAHMHE